MKTIFHILMILLINHPGWSQSGTKNESAGFSLKSNLKVVLISTLPDLLKVVKEDNKRIIMKPGNYVVTDLPNDS